jgi:hypothetical protein
MLGSIGPTLTASVAMGGVLLALYQPVRAHLESRIGFLSVMVVIGAVIYIGWLLLFARDFVIRQVGDLRRLVGWVSPLSEAEP